MSAAQVFVASTDITIGEHSTFSFLGMTFNGDTIYSTVIAGAIVIILGLLVARGASSRNPTKLQLIWESLVGWVTEQVEANLGRVNPFVIPLAISLFAFILIANWLELIPSGEDPKLLPAPTADVNLTYAMGLLVIASVQVYSFRRRGVKGYFHHYLEPYPVLLPLTVIEELVKPFTLALRLFGNIFSGGIMIAIIGLIPVWGLWAPNILWKLFDMAIGVIQAFIFALLTILYFGMAGTTHDEHEEEGHEDDRAPDEGSAGSPEADTAQPELSGAH
jgi:F-type H+-transporting ATPase subunit a